MSEKYVVDGYSFQTQEEANNAKNEADGIEYLKKRTNFNNPGSVLAVYNKIIEKKLFKTPIGYGFLREMQQILYNSPDIDDNEVYDIPVVKTAGKKEKHRKEKPVSLLPDEEEKNYKNKIVNLTIVNVFLIIIIIAIVAITNNSSNINILNYKDRLEREYKEKEDSLAVWAGQLKEKEQLLNSIENGE